MVTQSYQEWLEASEMQALEWVAAEQGTILPEMFTYTRFQADLVLRGMGNKAVKDLFLESYWLTSNQVIAHEEHFMTIYALIMTAWVARKRGERP